MPSEAFASTASWAGAALALGDVAAVEHEVFRRPPARNTEAEISSVNGRPLRSTNSIGMSCTRRSGAQATDELLAPLGRAPHAQLERGAADRLLARVAGRAGEGVVDHDVAAGRHVGQRDHVGAGGHQRREHQLGMAQRLLRARQRRHRARHAPVAEEAPGGVERGSPLTSRCSTLPSARRQRMRRSRNGRCACRSARCCSATPGSNSHAVYSQGASSNACGPEAVVGAALPDPCAGERRVDLPVGVGCDAERGSGSAPRVSSGWR